MNTTISQQFKDFVAKTPLKTHTLPIDAASVYNSKYSQEVWNLRYSDHCNLQFTILVVLPSYKNQSLTFLMNNYNIDFIMLFPRNFYPTPRYEHLLNIFIKWKLSHINQINIAIKQFEIYTNFCFKCFDALFTMELKHYCRGIVRSILRHPSYLGRKQILGTMLIRSTIKLRTRQAGFQGWIVRLICLRNDWKFL